MSAERDMPASSSACVVEQLLAESEALLASISGSSPSSPYSSSSFGSPRALSSSASACSSAGDTPTPSAVHAGQLGVKTKRRRNSTRDRRHCELQFLRRHVVELEAELEEKKTKMLVVHSDGAGDSTRGISSSVQPRPMSTWENVAQRQQRARMLSEKESQSLQSRAEKQAELMRTIRELLLAHRRRSPQWRQAYTNHLNNRMLAAGWEEAAEFARLKRDTVTAFTQSNRVLGVDNGTDVMPIPATEGNVFSHGYDKQKQRFVSRLISTRLFPFDAHATSNASWCAVNSSLDCMNLLSEGAGDTAGFAAAAEHVRITAQSDFHVVERTEDTYAVRYTVTLNMGPGVTLAVHVKEVVTRFASDHTTPGESVCIWQTSLSCSGPGQVSAAASGLGPPQIRGTGWIAFHKQPRACSSSVMRSVFEFHTEKQEAARGDGSDNIDSKEVELMKSWVTLGEACVDTISFEVDKSLL